MPTAYVNIGSNIGNRRSMLERAVALIKERWTTVRLSSVIQSEPWGYESPNMFLNIGAAFECLPAETPQQVHAHLQALQHSLCTDPHRNPDGTYTDRAIDIDLIAIDSLVLHTPQLRLPHPRMHLRPFVLIPMIELAPQWLHPTLLLIPSQMLAMTK